VERDEPTRSNKRLATALKDYFRFICVFGRAWLACVQVCEAPVFGSKYSGVHGKLEGVEGPYLQGWRVSTVRIACGFWVIGEGLSEKNLFSTYPAYLAPNMFTSIGRAPAT